MIEHHAFLCRTDKVEPESVYALIKELEITDVRYIDDEVIGIDNARSIIKLASIRPGSGKHQLIVICTNSIRVEAQQALLKVLEEPPDSTKFIVCVPTSVHLLPTLLSRLQEYKQESELEITDNTVEFKEFSNLSYNERILEIGKRLDKRDTEWVDKIKAGLAVKLTKEVQNLEKTTLSSLKMVVENLNTRGASNKILLEELALSLPAETQ